MNKLELIQALKNNNNLTTDEAKSVVNIFFNEISEALAKDERVEIRGLCSLYVRKYKSYTGKNPKTGKPTEVKSKILPFFKPGKELKERVDNK
ncbi:MAG: HU family DNA-binding protein [Thermodesulfobacteriota bacterium]|nr:HU family DNA-binding protein [Thermodesulfobacteriota bacterium]